MRSGRWTKAILAAALAATACKAPAGEPESGQRPLASATEKAPEKTTANADSEGEPDQPLTSGRWSLVDVQVVLANTEVAGLQPAAMADRLRDDLRLAGIARAADETGPAHEAAQLGVELAWQRLLASGISVAMYTTAFGLIVAIPTMLVHLFLSGVTKKIMDEIDQYSVRLENLLGQYAKGKLTPE